MSGWGGAPLEYCRAGGIIFSPPQPLRSQLRFDPKSVDTIATMGDKPVCHAEDGYRRMHSKTGPPHGCRTRGDRVRSATLPARALPTSRCDCVPRSIPVTERTVTSEEPATSSVEGSSRSPCPPRVSSCSRWIRGSGCNVLRKGRIRVPDSVWGSGSAQA